MPRIIEVLSDVNEHVATFTVDTAQTVVGATASGPFGVALYSTTNGSLTKVFNAGDSFSILSFGLVFPKAYGITVESVLGGPVVLPRFTITAKSTTDAEEHIIVDSMLPWGDYEMDINNYFDAPARFSNGQQFELFVELAVNTWGVDMLNVPVSEEGKVYNISSFLKIEHSAELMV